MVSRTSEKSLAWVIRSVDSTEVGYDYWDLL